VQISGAGTPEKRYSDAVKELKVVETYKKQYIVVNDVCFCSSAMLTSKIIAEIYYRKPF